MTTNQRSVAEDLIARTPEGSWDHARAVERLVRAIIGKRFDEPYTADDLLAWLREQDVAVWALDWATGDTPTLLTASGGIFLHVVTATDSHNIHAPTLLGALELAVRAVAGEP